MTKQSAHAFTKQGRKAVAGCKGDARVRIALTLARLEGALVVTKAWMVLLLFALAGCADEPVRQEQMKETPAGPGPEHNETVPESDPPVVVANITSAAREFWIGMDQCVEYDFQSPVVDKAPDESWYPEGASPVFIVPGTASYAFFLLRCEQVLVDNTTLYEDAHFVVVEAGVTLAEDDPYSSTTDQLHIQAFTDVPEIQERMAAEGFWVELAEFVHIEETTVDTWSITTQNVNVEIVAAEPGTDRGFAFDPDTRLHSVSQLNGGHIYYDFLRQGDLDGFQQEYPRVGVGRLAGTAIEGASGHMLGLYSEHAMQIDLRIPIWQDA